MRRNLLVILLLLLVGFGLGFLFDSPLYGSAPRFSFETQSGETHDLAEFQDKIIILNFWASWCPPCVKEFPRLVNIAREHGDKTVLIALSSDVDDQTIDHFLHEQGYANLPNILVARDKADITQNFFHIAQLPETYVLDHNLKIRAKFIGADWTPDEMEAAIIAIEKGK